MKTSKITQIKSQKQWKDVTYYSLILENGDKINIGKKKPLSVGQDIVYEIDANDDGQQEFMKAKTPKVDSNGMQPNTSFTKSESRDESIYKCNSLNNAVALHAGGNASVERVIETAKVFYNYLTGTDNKTESKTDDLPF